MCRCVCVCVCFHSQSIKCQAICFWPVARRQQQTSLSWFIIVCCVYYAAGCIYRCRVCVCVRESVCCCPYRHTQTYPLGCTTQSPQVLGCGAVCYRQLFVCKPSLKLFRVDKRTRPENCRAENYPTLQCTIAKAVECHHWVCLYHNLQFFSALYPTRRQIWLEFQL